jgi:hypothetical protein
MWALFDAYLSMAFMGAGCTLFGPKVAVKGRVVTDHGGKDVAAYQALVTIGKAAPVETDYDGTFEVVGVKTGKQSVTIEKEGFETVTKTVDINADNADLGDLYIVPNEGATLTVEPEWILPLLSKSMEALENQTRPIDIKPDTVIAEATIDVVLEQDGGKRYTAGAKTRLVWTGFGVEAQSSGTLIIMGIEHEAGTGYTLTATGTAGSDYFDDSIVIQGEAKIAAEEFDDGKYVWDFAIDLSAFVEQRPQ